MYFHEPKMSEYAAYECNTQPFFTFTHAIMCLSPKITLHDIVHYYYVERALQRMGVKSSNSAMVRMT